MSQPKTFSLSTAPNPWISGARDEQLQEFLDLELCQTGPLSSHH
uniref:Uncharacterized protein n=1 Tax=Arundo donax TaxID=35708 RepID=A0A0A9BV52_ARUDO